MATVAVRIPHSQAQVPLYFLPSGPQVFIHQGARQRLERRVEASFGGPVQLGVTDNRRSRRTRQRSPNEPASVVDVPDLGGAGVLGCSLDAASPFSKANAN